MSFVLSVPRTLLFCVVVLPVCVLLYYPGLSGPFLFDDVHTVRDNEWVKVDSLDTGSLHRASASFASGGRELAMVSFAVNSYLFGHGAFAYKAVNLGIHCIIGLLMLIVCRCFVRNLPRTDEDRYHENFRWLPEIVATLWLLNPVNLTSVLYVSQRMNSLSALFTLAGVLVYVSWRNRLRDSGRQWWPAYPLVLVCLVAAYKCKENGLLLVPLLLVVEACIFRFKDSKNETNWRLILALLMASMIVIGAGATAKGFSLAGLADSYSHREFTLEERVLTQPRVLIFYIGLILFPLEWRMGLWHDDFQISSSLFSPLDTFTSIGLIVLLLAIGIAVWRRYPLYTLGIFWFFVGHSMESTILPLEMVHEHRNYLPSFGLLLASAAFLTYLSAVRKTYKMLFLGSFLALAAVNLHARASVWSDEFRLALNEFMNHPTSPRASFDLAAKNAKLAFHGVPAARDAAMSLLRHGQELGDRTITPEVAMLVVSSILRGEYRQEWIRSAVEKIRMSGTTIPDTVALRSLRECMEENNCRIEADDVRPLFEAAAQSGFPLAIYESAHFFDYVGDIDRSLDELERVAKINSGRFEFKVTYIWALIHAGRYSTARDFIRSLEERSVDVDVRYRLHYEQAKARLEKLGYAID